MTFGVVSGQAIAGYVGEHYGWRLPFAVVAIPGIFVAMLLMFFVEEPVRGAMEETPDEEQSSEQEFLVSSRPSTPPVPRGANASTGAVMMYLRKVHGIVSVKTVALFLMQGISGCVPWSMINTFLNDYLAQDKGLGVKHSTTLLITFSVGGMIGTVLAGCTSNVYNDLRKSLLFMGATATQGLRAYLVLADYDRSGFDLTFKFIIALFAGLIVVRQRQHSSCVAQRVASNQSRHSLLPIHAHRRFRQRIRTTRRRRFHRCVRTRIRVPALRSLLDSVRSSHRRFGVHGEPRHPNGRRAVSERSRGRESSDTSGLIPSVVGTSPRVVVRLHAPHFTKRSAHDGVEGGQRHPRAPRRPPPVPVGVQNPQMRDRVLRIRSGRVESVGTFPISLPQRIDVHG